MEVEDYFVKPKLKKYIIYPDNFNKMVWDIIIC